MKKVLLTLLVVGMAITGFAQDTNDKKRKTISVNGVSEIEITPDIIYLNITLQEYQKDKNNKVDISTLEDQLTKAIQKAGIPAENLTISSVSGEQWWRKKKKDADFYASKEFRLKLSTLTKLNTILDGVEDGGITNVYISEVTSSKIEDYRLQAKIKALQAAKAKANAMMEGIGEKIGGVVEVVENSVDIIHPVYANNMITIRGVNAYDKGVADTNIDYRTIKVTADIKAVFAIQ
ncbi:SIMPL domain-containing protein [Chitinophaga sp.]|uniref:SIMPL domain-containing protein n=1 Tax=Chitinophaga sp. TaxID=1869181 RepID=UPI0031D16F37